MIPLVATLSGLVNLRSNVACNRLELAVIDGQTNAI